MKEPQPETVDLVFELSKDEYLKLLQEADALDGKLVAIFGIGSIMIGVISGLGQDTFSAASQWDWTLFSLASLFFGVTVGLCTAGLWRRQFIGPLNPAKVQELYLRKDPAQAKKEHLEFLTAYYATNLRHVRNKGFFAYWALPALGGEVALLFAWLLASPFI